MNDLKTNNKKFICKLDKKFIDKACKIFDNIKTSNVNEVFIYLSNYNESYIFFYLEQKTVNVRIFLPSVVFYEKNNEIFSFVGKEIFNIEKKHFDNFVESLKKDYYLTFSLIDIINFAKCFDQKSNGNIVVFDFDKNIVKVSGGFSVANILLSENTKQVVNNIEKKQSMYKTTCVSNFCTVKQVINLFEYSYIICSNAYGRIVNKATGFVYLDGFYYCVNTNGRILAIKRLDTNFTQSFNISVPKNISKFFVDIDKNSLVNAFVNNNVCELKSDNIHIEFQLIDQKHYINTLIMHEFNEKICIDCELFDNIFCFFNKVKGLTAESAIVLYKEKNSLEVFCLISDEKNNIKTFIGCVDKRYCCCFLNIKLSFDIFNLIKLIIKKLVSEKKFIYNFSYDNKNNSSFANISIENIGISLFFAIR